MTRPLAQEAQPTQPLHLARVLAACFLALSACKAKSDTATNEQLLLLFGEKPLFADGPDLQISKTTIECIRLISGLDEQLYKDAPAEMLGRIKTQCRIELDAKLKNATLNPLGLTLKDVEEKGLADRLTALKQRVDAQLEAKAEAAREHELAVQRAKIQDVLAKTEKETTQFANSLTAQFNDIVGLCDTWRKQKEQLVKADKHSKYRWRIMPSPCEQSFRDNVQRQLLAANKQLDQVKAKPANEITEFNIPNLHFISAFKTSLSSLKEEVKVMQALTAKAD